MISHHELVVRSQEVTRTIEASRKALYTRHWGLGVEGWDGHKALEVSLEEENISRQRGIAILERGRQTLEEPLLDIEFGLMAGAMRQRRAAREEAIIAELQKPDDIVIQGGFGVRVEIVPVDEPQPSYALTATG